MRKFGNFDEEASAMQCIKCGTLLLPGMMDCPRCGTPASYSEPTPSSPGAGTDYTLPAAGYGPIQESVSTPPAAQAGGTPPPGYYGAVPPQGTPPPNIYNTDPRPANYGMPPYAAAPPYLPPNAQQPLTPIQPPPPLKRRGLSRMMVILLSILVLLILVGSGLIYYFSVPYPAQIHAQATATVQTQANDRATGTAVFIHNIHATATAQAQATLTVQQSMYMQATNGSPVVTDSLAQNSSLNWEEYDLAGNRGCAFAGGAYHVKEQQQGYFETCYARASNFSNLTLQVQMTLLSGNAGGVIFRANSTSGKFYRFDIDSKGECKLYMYVDFTGTNAQTLLDNPCPAIHTSLNQSNLITVIAQGSNLTFFVNKQYVDTISDKTLKSGEIGLIASDLNSPTEVAYNNIQVWNLS